MSAPLITYEGYHGLMGAALASFANGNNAARLRLFQNNYYPTQNTVWSDLQEADFFGYSPGVPTIPVDQGLAPTFIDWWKFPPITFTQTALPMQTIFGYWIDFVNPITSQRQSLWVKRFDSPFLFTGPGVSLPVILTPGFKQGTL